jgi:uncharacterized protein (TIRG00374 family)
LRLALRIFVLLLGLAVFAWFVREVDPVQIGAEFRKLGWLAPLALAPYLTVYLADTLGWRFAFGKGLPPSLGFLQMFRVRWMGEAVSNLTPTAQLGGEAVKVYLLGKRGYSSSQAAASVVVGKTLQFLAQAIFLAFAAAVALQVFENSAPIRLAIALVVVICWSAVVGLFFLQKQGLSQSILALFSSIGIRLERFASQIRQLRGVDGRIIDYYTNEQGYFAASAGSYLIGWTLDTLEIWLVSHWMGVPLDWSHAIAIEAFVAVAKGFGSLAPGSIGVQEAGIVLLCRLAGAPDSFGVAYAVFRRGREVLFAGFGWGMLFFEESSLSGLGARVERDSRSPS